MTEEELSQKTEELKKLEDSLTQKEAELAAKQADLESKEADVNKITENIKQGFESQIEKLTADYEERLKTRDDVIAQLSASDGQEQPHVSIIDHLNERRVAQNKKW
jgi:peptidoglycan hydrolase CwlO-like protein